MKHCYTMLSVCCMALAVSLALAGCASTKGAGQQPAVYGTWDYTMSNPTRETLSGRMTIGEAEDGSYTSRLTVREAEIDEINVIENLEINGPVFTLNGSADGSEFTLTGTVEGDTMTGKLDLVDVGVYTLNATRVAE